MLVIPFPFFIFIFYVAKFAIASVLKVLNRFGTIYHQGFEVKQWTFYLN